MTSENSVTIVVPALNEERHLEPAVRIMVEGAKAWFDEFEILLFNDGSTDRTGEIAEALSREFPQVRAFHHPRPTCVGGVLREGFAAAKMHYAIYVDGKGATTRESLDTIFSHKGQADLVIPYDTNLAGRGLRRRIVSWCFRKLLNLLFWQRIRYYGTGALVKTEQLRRFRIRTNSYGFNAEMIIKMVRSGCSYVQVGVCDRHDDTGRKTKAFRWQNVRGIAAFLARTWWDVYVARNYRTDEARA